MRVTFGMEIEFYLPSLPINVPTRLVELGFHCDHNRTYEISLPPTSLENYDEFAQCYKEAKRLIEEIGGYLCAEYEEIRNRWTNGCHIHLRIEPENPVIWARALNWCSILSSLLAPLQASCIKVLNIDGFAFVHEYCDEKHYVFRYRVRHFAEPPPKVSWRTMSILLRKPRKFRSLFPIEEANDFYAVEINRYRKSVTTIEIRTNEMGWKTSVAIADLVNMLATMNTPKVPIRQLFRYFVTPDIPRSIHSASPIEFDHEVLKGNPSCVDAARQLLEYADRVGYRLKPPTKQLLTILATEERRPFFDETI